MRKIAMPSEDMTEKLLSREERLALQERRRRELQERGEDGQGS